MPTRKYIVRDGFVVPLVVEKQNGDKHVKLVDAGEEISLSDEDAALHAHKLQFAKQSDRDAALAAEKEVATAQAAQNSPAELVQLLVGALSQVLAAAPAPAVAAAPAPAVAEPTA
jgi:hypothetical protein